MKLYKTPFSLGYWRDAAGELKDLRKLVFAALMIAACLILNKFKIPLGENLSLSVTFLARALCAAVCGPLVAIVFGAAEDTLGFFLSTSSGPYFPGYMITTITGCIIYALFFYRARITLWRIIIAKLITNIQNVLLGSLWSAMLYSKGYIYYMSTSGVKNLLYYPVQVLLLVLLLQEVLPVMHRLRWSPCQLEGERIPWL
ncbi:MAG: folate family ECF transporter S component [Oscillospiraceae bacterium]|nr:folate family ECF transporter S component [Oscillospiraceae bacterium]